MGTGLLQLERPHESNRGKLEFFGSTKTFAIDLNPIFIYLIGIVILRDLLNEPKDNVLLFKEIVL